MRVFARHDGQPWAERGEWACVVRYGNQIGSVVAVGKKSGCAAWIGTYGPSVVVRSDSLIEVKDALSASEAPKGL